MRDDEHPRNDCEPNDTPIVTLDVVQRLDHPSKKSQKTEFDRKRCRPKQINAHMQICEEYTN